MGNARTVIGAQLGMVLAAHGPTWVLPDLMLNRLEDVFGRLLGADKADAST